jgi:serine/threonine protein kinase
MVASSVAPCMFQPHFQLQKVFIKYAFSCCLTIIHSLKAIESMELSTLLSCSSERTVLFSEVGGDDEASTSQSGARSGTTFLDIINFLLQSRRSKGFMRFIPSEFVSGKSIFKLAEGTSYRVDKGVVVGEYGIQVAVKHLKGPANSSTYATVLRELRILTHEPLRENPNIVRLFGYGTETVDFGLSLYLVAEFAEFGTLRDFLRGNSTVSLTDKANFCHDMAIGLAGLHSCGIVHGDFKLENTLVFRNHKTGFIVKLSDFGHAILDDISSYLGTRYLNAPEIRRGQLRSPQNRSLYYKCDIFSYGLAISETLQDGRRFIDTSRHDIAWLNALKKDEPLRWALQTTQDQTLQKILNSSLRDDPEERGSIMDLVKLFWRKNKFRERYAVGSSRASTSNFSSTRLPDLSDPIFNVRMHDCIPFNS